MKRQYFYVIMSSHIKESYILTGAKQQVWQCLNVQGQFSCSIGIKKNAFYNQISEY